MLKNALARSAHSPWESRKARFCIIDVQSVKNTDTAEEKGYEAGKKVSGIKKHIAVDTQGLIHAIEITTADITDRAGALQATKHHQKDLSSCSSVALPLIGRVATVAVCTGSVWLAAIGSRPPQNNYFLLAGPAYNQLRAPLVIDGPINGATFRAYLEEILAPTRPWAILWGWTI
jgi:hypothetical protein